MSGVGNSIIKGVTESLSPRQYPKVSSVSKIAIPTTVK